MLSALLVAHALASEPTLAADAPAAVALPAPTPAPERTALHRAGRRTLVAGGITTAAAVPAGLVTLGLATAECRRTGTPECMTVLFAPAVTGLVGVAGLTTAAVGGTLLAVDAVRGPRDVAVGVAPTGLVVSGRF